MFIKERITASYGIASARKQARTSISQRAVWDKDKTFSFHLHAHPDIASPICLQAFRNLLGIFKYQWKSLKSSASTPGPIAHGNSGKRNRHNGSAAKTVAADVVAFLTKIGNDLVNCMPQGLSMSGRHLAYGKKKKIL